MVAGVLAMAASACAYGVESIGPGTTRDAGTGGAGGKSVGPTGSSGDNASVSTGGGGMSTNGSAGSDSNPIVDITAGSGGAPAEDGSAGAPNTAIADASDAAMSIKDSAPAVPPCPMGGKALSFDGTSRVDIPGTALPIGNSARTVEMWISPAAVAAPPWSPNHTVFEYGSGDLKTFAVDMDATPMMELYVNPAANSFFFNTGISQTTWFHVAVTYDGATTTRAFVNGVDKGSKTLTGQLANAVSTLSVGGTAASRYFIGSIDEVRVWNGARTASQIQQNMSVRLTGNEGGLVGYWRFDEGAGSSVADSSTKGIAGTLVGPVGWINSGVALTCK
jgi:hypothetical protein